MKQTLGLFLFAIFLQTPAHAASICVEKTYASSMDMLAEAYDSSRFLGWGITSHVDDFSPSFTLNRFLEHVGSDENLKYVFTELPPQLNGLLQKIASGTETIEDLKRSGLYQSYFIFQNINHQIQADYQYVYRRIGEINKTRKNKIKIVGIDSRYMIDAQNSNVPATSWNRESQTAVNFSAYYKNMRSQDKAIFIYHAAHLVRNVTGATLNYDQAGNVIEQKNGPSSFLGMVPNFNESEYKLVVFENQASGKLPWFQNQGTSPAGVPYKLSATSSSFACMSYKTSLDTYIANPQYPTPLTTTFTYVVPRPADSGLSQVIEPAQRPMPSMLY